MDVLDKELWETARKRIEFRRHLYIYLIVNALLWIIWLVDNLRYWKHEEWLFPWPIFPMVGWGISLTIHFTNAYLGSKDEAIRREFEKLNEKRRSEVHKDITTLNE